MDYFISDMHFGHEDRVKWDARPFKDAAEMFSVMRERWNARVREDDDVWIVGDFTYYGETDDENIRHYALNLNGRKHLIYGNHDDRIKNSPALQHLFCECVYEKFIERDGRKIFLAHYPMVEWYRRPQGCVLIYDHIHGSCDDGYDFMAAHRKDEAFNAGCMINGYVPVTFEELALNNESFRQQYISDKEK